MSGGPTFLPGDVPATLILVVAAAGAAVLAWAEWRRVDRRRRGWRVAASLLAVSALALLALRPAWRRGNSPAKQGAGDGPEAALWTDGARVAEETSPAKVPSRLRFRLPGADAPAGVLTTTLVPDAAFLRRHFPEIGTLHLFGDGLDADSLAVLSPWRLVFHPAPTAADGVPRMDFLRAPRVLGPGEPLVVEGHVAGGNGGRGGNPAATDGGALELWLEGPDGTRTTAPVRADGTFRLRGGAAGLPVAGRYLWRLRLCGRGGTTARVDGGERVFEEETLGVSVVAPVPPRVLWLESAPHPDTAALRRWLGAAGGVVASRTAVGRGRFRFGATGGKAPEAFAAVDAGLLGRFDLLVADVRALAAMPATERAAVRAAVADTGLGVLLLFAGNSGTPPGDGEKLPAEDLGFFLPWRLEPAGEQDDAPTPLPTVATGTTTTTVPATTTTGGRTARLRWTMGAGHQTGEETAPDVPVPLVPFTIATSGGGEKGGEGTRVLVRDGQGRAVAAEVGRGRGRVALTLTEDTARWRRTGEPGVFAAFWSALLAEVARREEPSGAGRWTLTKDGATGPVFVDGPVELRWQGRVEKGTSPPQGTVTAEAGVGNGRGDDPVALPLPLAPDDPSEATRWTARFWPRHAGWHRVQTPPDGGGPALDFHVAAPDAWPGVRAARQRQATARFVATNDDAARRKEAGAAADRPPDPVESAFVASVLFGVFLVTAGYLWAEGFRASSLGTSEDARP